MRILLIACWLLLCAPVACAFPDRPLTLVMPYPATGSPDIDGTSRITKLIRTMQSFSVPPLTDSLARELVQLLTAALNQTVNLDRHPAGNTIAGTHHAAQAEPDGYTLLFAGNPTITIYPSLYPQLPFDPQRDLAPVAALARMPMALIATRDNPAITVRHVIERARRMPGRINYAALGDGSTSHLTGELFRTMSGAEMVHVNYNGSAPAINAVVTRNVEFGFVPLTSALPFLNGGRIRIIAVSSAARHASVAAVPTVVESGLTGFEADGWFGVFAPAGTPRAVISLLNRAINRALSEDILQRMLIKQGLAAAPGTPENFRDLIVKDTLRWSRLLRTVAASR